MVRVAAGPWRADATGSGTFHEAGRLDRRVRVAATARVLVGPASLHRFVPRWPHLRWVVRRCQRCRSVAFPLGLLDLFLLGLFLLGPALSDLVRTLPAHWAALARASCQRAGSGSENLTRRSTVADFATGSESPDFALTLGSDLIFAADLAAV